MIYLVLAILSSMLVSVLMRLSETRIHNRASMLACNYLMWTVLAASFAGAVPLPREGVAFTVGLGLVSGAMYLGGFLLLQWNIARNGVVLSATFMKLGVLVPTAMAMLIFGERPGAVQMAGMLLAFLAILLINLERGSQKAASRAGLVLLLLVGGSTDATAKIFEELGQAPLKDTFLLITFVTALLLCVAVCIARRQSLTGADLLFGLLIGAPNYFSSRFLLLSLNDVPAVIAYPTYSVGTIVLIALLGVWLFHERLSRRQTLAMGMILAALALLNL